MNREKKDSIIAAGVTLVAVVAILLLLLFGTISYDEITMPETTANTVLDVVEEEEELFIEPELLTDLGEPDATTNDSPAPAIKGTPDLAEKENTRKVEPGTNQKPAQQRELPVSQTKSSTVKETAPSATDEERQRVTSSMAKGFKTKNGNSDGKEGASGSGGTGVGTSGVASGRTFKGCPKPQVALSNKVTVTVSVVIDASGKVTSAHAKGGAAAYIRVACEQAALQAKWSEKADAPATNGTITFTITPK
jgi:outer membrane biosynthesis protein TonB